MSETLNETSALALQMKIIDDPTWQQQRQAHWDEEHQDAYAECWPHRLRKDFRNSFLEEYPRRVIQAKGIAVYETFSN